MRISHVVSLALVLFAATSMPRAEAAPRKRQSYRRQHPSAHPVSAGAYVGAGLNSAQQPLERVGGLQGQVGIYAELARFRLRPGLDARLQGEQYSLPGLWGSSPGGSVGAKVIGPRVAFAFSTVHPYVEGLFGTGHQHDTLLKDGSSADASGVMKMAVAGVDFDADTHLNLRIEYSAGQVATPQGFLMLGLTAGVVFRFP